LHESGCFVLPNPWDVGTAVYLQHLGFRALATTSAGVAFSRGMPDETPALPLDVMLAHIRDVVEATSLPVNADFQSRVAWGAFIRAAESIARTGTFDAFADAAPFGELNNIFRRGTLP
jgi:2-methylisocitrate lyase-like PEP mutase family enzyme